MTKELSETPAVAEPQAELSPRPRAWAENWDDPTKQRQMSAVWPLLWLAIPFVLLVVYGLLAEP